MPMTNYLTELPQVGSTEIWEIINMTADAHPIHLHLVQFQVLNRQNYNTKQYNNAYILGWSSPFIPKGQYEPAFGPPFPYNDVQGQFNGIAGLDIIGGNPDVTPYLQGQPAPPAPYERGWKDTVIAMPKQVTRIVVRFAPMELAAATPGTDHYLDAPYSFAATEGPGYVWHCHIIDHEDNEMMRPYHLIRQHAKSYEVSFSNLPSERSR